MSIHISDAFIVSCMDFRFQKYIRKWLDKNMGDKTYDYVGFAGASKDLKTIMMQLDISVRLHHIKQVILIHHEDCGAYGKESTHERHVKDLKKAQAVINAIYPDLQVNLYYLHLDGKFEKI
jgi:carbonic anhydrase